MVTQDQPDEGQQYFADFRDALDRKIAAEPLLTSPIASLSKTHGIGLLTGLASMQLEVAVQNHRAGGPGQQFEDDLVGVMHMLVTALAACRQLDAEAAATEIRVIHPGESTGDPELDAVVQRIFDALPQPYSTPEDDKAFDKMMRDIVDKKVGEDPQTA